MAKCFRQIFSDFQNFSQVFQNFFQVFEMHLFMTIFSSKLIYYNTEKYNFKLFKKQNKFCEATEVKKELFQGLFHNIYCVFKLCTGIFKFLILIASLKYLLF